MARIYAAGALTGGGVGALDAIDGTNLADLDIAIVVTLTDTYFYSLDDDSGASESSPDVITPDNNAGSKRWILVEKFAGDTVVLLTATQTLTNKTLTTPTLTSPVLNTGVSGSAVLDEDAMGSDSDTQLATQQSIKAYIDSGTVTMTNKTLTDPVLDGDLSGGSGILDENDMSSDSDTQVATQQSIKAYVDSGIVTMTNKTLTSPVLNTGVSGTAVLDEDNMVSDSDTQLATQQSIKKYVDDEISGVAHTIQNLAKGSILIYAEEDWTEYSHSTTTFTTKMTIGIYVPSTSGTLYIQCQTKGNGVANAYSKFTINSQDSDTAETSQATNYEWNEIYKDVSALSAGIYEVDIKIATTTGVNTAYLKGIVAYWGP